MNLNYRYSTLPGRVSCKKQKYWWIPGEKGKCKLCGKGEADLAATTWWSESYSCGVKTGQKRQGANSTTERGVGLLGNGHPKIKYLGVFIWEYKKGARE